MLAEANICMGGNRLKKAEEFLIAAFWNLLKFTSDENDKGANSEFEDALVSDSEIKRYTANLRITWPPILGQTRRQLQQRSPQEFD